MSPGHDIRADLEPDAPEELIRLAERLDRERPVPSAAFRGDLRRRLLAGEISRSRPARVRLLITGYASAGTALLLVGAASAAGIGPLGAERRLRWLQSLRGRSPSRDPGPRLRRHRP